MRNNNSGYRPLRNKDKGEMTVLGRKFYVHLAGITNGAHQAFVEKFKDVGKIEVQCPEESDYLLVFCPIASRVGTDISEALDNMPGDKPAILVVMHHTFSPDHVVAPSMRQVNNPNVLLTVDCLFYERDLLKCNRNDIAWHAVQKFLGIPLSQDSIWNYLGSCKCDCNYELPIRLLNSIFKLHSHGQQYIKEVIARCNPTVHLELCSDTFLIRLQCNRLGRKSTVIKKHNS
ncbi:uncharacterized protein LOC118493844 isoform X2 [Sander lucioperca]|uniref:uncharacterized protein LOC118493844 isoform X2 n=1 Tax=Sander lucioperca TaxID=283035 RepID=UPI001653468D|nr:uncharacterized protein LOC118493844 isoform X2 [Sander lucioperca]